MFVIKCLFSNSNISIFLLFYEFSFYNFSTNVSFLFGVCLFYSSFSFLFNWEIMSFYKFCRYSNLISFFNFLSNSFFFFSSFISLIFCCFCSLIKYTFILDYSFSIFIFSFCTFNSISFLIFKSFLSCNFKNLLYLISFILSIFVSVSFIFDVWNLFSSFN